MSKENPSSIFEWRKWGEKASKKDLFSFIYSFREESGSTNQPKRYVERSEKIANYLTDIFERRFGKND